MILSETRILIQKLIVLGTLIACLGILSAGVRTSASTDARNNMIPCCSFCDENPGSPYCRHGCSDSCRAKQ